MELFHNVNFDWLGRRRYLLTVSILLMLVGLASAVMREAVPGGTNAFNLGVDFQAGTVVTVNFKQPTTAEQVRAALESKSVREASIQGVVGNANQVQIKVPQQSDAGDVAQAGNAAAQVDAGRSRIAEGLSALGNVGKLSEGADVEIVGTDSVGPVAGRALRNQAVTVTLLALVGILAYIAFRFEWTYGAAAVITVFHDVLVTLGFFSIFQIEIDLTVVAALLTLVGFSVNDTIVTFDRVRENLRLHRRESLYNITNDAINQTLSRTIITSGLVLLSVLALVLFGGEVLRGFSLALLIGIIVGTYSTFAIASPLMVWFQQRLEGLPRTSSPPQSATRGGGGTRPKRPSVTARPEAKTVA